MSDARALYAKRQVSLAKSAYSVEDREAIAKFLNYVQAQGVQDKRLVKYTSQFNQLQKILPAALTKLTKDQLDKMLAGINQRHDWMPWTKHDYFVTLKKFYRYYDKTDARYGRIRVHKPAMKEINEEEVLVEDEIESLEACAPNLAVRAMVRFLFDSAGAETEFITMRIKDVTEKPPFLVFHLPGTKNQFRDRKIPLHSLNKKSHAIFREYLAAHPRAKDPNAFLWLSQNQKPLTAPNMAKTIRLLAKKAGITKRVNPHFFRSSKITQLRLLGISDSAIKQYAGWSKDSQMIGVYSATGFNALFDSILKLKPESTDEKSQRVSAEVAGLILSSPKLMHMIIEEMQRKGKLGLLKGLANEKGQWNEKTEAPGGKRKKSSNAPVPRAAGSKSKRIAVKKGGRFR